MKMDVNDIKISKVFEESKPQDKKLNRCRKHYDLTGHIDRKIIIDKNNYLLDGYVGYLILKEKGVKSCKVTVDDGTFRKKESTAPTWWYTPTTYVFGNHKQDTRTFVWRITENTKNIDNLAIGKKAIVETRNGHKEITITDIKVMERPPLTMWIKKVLSCNGKS